jgi:serine/threonine protein kinase
LRIFEDQTIKLTDFCQLGSILKFLQTNDEFNKVIDAKNHPFIIWPPEFSKKTIHLNSDYWTLGVLLFQLFSDNFNPFRENYEVNINLIYEFTPQIIIDLIINLLKVDPNQRCSLNNIYSSLDI